MRTAANDSNAMCDPHATGQHDCLGCGRPVMMYCTGGIRCERASALLELYHVRLATHRLQIIAHDAAVLALEIALELCTVGSAKTPKRQSAARVSPAGRPGTGST